MCTGEKSLAAEYQQRGRGCMAGLLQMPAPSYSTSGPATPHANFRVGSNEALEIANRNRGSMNLLMTTAANKNYSSPRPNPKLGSNTGRDIAQQNRGTMNLLMTTDANKNYASPRPNPKLGSNSAREIAQQGRGCMDLVMSVDLSYQDPAPASRLRGSARDVAHRNSGTSLHKVMHRPDYPDSARPGSRLSGEGMENGQKGRGVMSTVMNNNVNRNYHSARREARIKPEAADNAVRGRGNMASVMDVDANRNYSMPPPEARVKPEAQSIAFKSSGVGMSKVLDSSANIGYDSPKAGPRVSMEATETALQGRGTMGIVLGARSAPPSPGPAAPRVKPEAEEAATKNRGTLTNQYANYGKVGPSAAPDPKVSGDGQGNYQAGQGRGMQKLLSNTNLPRSGRPPARVKGEGGRIANANRGTMASMFNPGKPYKTKPAW